MKKVLILTSLLIFSSIMSFSQDEARNPMNVKFNMLALFDPVSSYQFSFEHGIGGRFNMQYELGYITHNSPIYYGDDQKRDGFRAKTEMRYFLQDRVHTSTGMYFSAELMWNRYTTTKEEEFAMDDWTYFKMQEVVHKKNIFAFHQKFGYQAGIYNSRAVFDFYIGLGLRSVLSITDYPEEGEATGWNDSMFDLFGRDGDYFIVIPSFTLGYKLGIFLHKQ